MINCKTIDAKTGNLDVKVLVELHEANFFGQYKMTAKLSEISNKVYSIKGDYWMVTHAFETFDVNLANHIADNAWKTSGRNNWN